MGLPNQTISDEKLVELSTDRHEEMVSDIPLRMRNRPIGLIFDWFLKFGVDLEESIRSGSRDAEGFSILDHCCGIGLAAEDLARSSAINELGNIHVTGVDLKTDPHQVRAAYHDGTVVADLVNADALHLPFPTSSFDLVYSMAGIAYIDDGQAALEEAHRVLKPSGRAFFYLMKGGLDISCNIPLDTMCSDIEGAEFVAHTFLDHWRSYWREHPDQAPFYLDGIILEMRKTGPSFDSPHFLWATIPLFEQPVRSFEKHTSSGIYLKR